MPPDSFCALSSPASCWIPFIKQMILSYETNANDKLMTDKIWTIIEEAKQIKFYALNKFLILYKKYLQSLVCLLE